MSCSKPIYLLINSYGLGGAETANVHLANAFSDLGYRVHLVILKGTRGPEAVHRNVSVHYLNFDGYSAKKVKTVSHASVQKVKELIEVTGGGRELSASIGMIASLPLANRIASFFPPERVVYWLHFPVTYSDLNGKNIIRRYMRRRRLSEMYAGRKIACPSRGVLDDYHAIFGNDGSGVRVVFNPMFREMVQEKARHDLDSLGVSLRRPYFVHLARFVPQKRHDRMLRAFSIFLEQSGADVDLLCLGNGPLLSEMKKLAEELGVAERVHFGGYLENPYPVLRDAKALLLSSDYEALGMVLLEALMLGVPCLSTRCPSGPDEILTGELSQWLVDLDEEALADGMQRMYENPPDVSGYDFSRFDPKQVAQQYIDLLKA